MRRLTTVIGALAAVLAVPPVSGSMSQERLPQSSAEESVLSVRRNATESELRELARAIADAREKAEGLQASLDGIEKTTASLRSALVDSATRRKDLERKVIANEERITTLSEQEKAVKISLLSRRGLLSEVIGALERMGRNPPPALLVSPEDALGSVRSAILLGAVVPGIRKETDKLASDLKSLSQLRIAISREKRSFVTTMASALEEEKRMNLLLMENDRLEQQNKADLEREKARAAELAARATSLESLITALEREIASARDAARKADTEEARRKAQTPEEQARAQASLPDKNRIAPAYAFSELKAKLDLPVAGNIIRAYGDDDGTGHAAQGVMVAAGPGLVVTAPADGWIMFAGPFRSYGQMVIMNVGDGYHIVMAGMETVTARQGQFAVAGEPLGQMGEKRIASAAALKLETERPTLYIEFRKDGKPVDSHAWWSVKDLGKARNDT